MKISHKISRNTLFLTAKRVFEYIIIKPRQDRLYHICSGHIYFQTLHAAIDIGVFDLLQTTPNITAKQIARSVGIDEKPARILLLGCVSLGLLKKRGENYRNARCSTRLFVSNAPRSIVPIIQWQHHINYRPMANFTEALRANRNVGLDEYEGSEPTLYERLAHVPELEQIFQDAMRAISIQANKLLAEHVDFSQFKHVVDVGGGNGTNMINLVTAFPHLKATVFDSPSVCEIAKKNIAEHGLSDRISTVEGNCFKDPFPEADCILFCHFMTIWSAEKNTELLKKAYQGIPESGAVLVFNMMQNDDRTGPLSASMGSPYFLTLATGEGMLYTWSEYKEWMREAGFTSVNQLKLIMDHGVIIGTKQGVQNG
jgi:ubiquinone/menaquinone biosynthesis C-methylase UbiE